MRNSIFKSNKQDLCALQRISSCHTQDKIRIQELPIPTMKQMQCYRAFLLCAIGRLLSNAEILRSSCRRYGIFQLVAENTRLDASVIETIVANTLLMCSMQCINDVLCKSINYNAKAMKCERLSGNKLTDGEAKLIVANSWEHYEPENVKAKLQYACRKGFCSRSCGLFQKYEADLGKTEGLKCVDLQNIALGKATENQPENSNLPSALAVDGNSPTSLSNGSCTETGCCTPLPWWRVDFGSTALVYSINITSRGDCCGNRLSDFNVRVGESDIGRGENNTMCQQNIAVPQGQTSTFICNPPMYGRYLYVQTNLEKRLPLCEVEVYGETFMKGC